MSRGHKSRCWNSLQLLHYERLFWLVNNHVDATLRRPARSGNKIRWLSEFGNPRFLQPIDSSVASARSLATSRTFESSHTFASYLEAYLNRPTPEPMLRVSYKSER